MNDALAARARAAICSKGLDYFDAHGLGDLLAEMGTAHDPAAVRAMTMRLIEDEAHGLVDAIAAGLRETASGDGEFARLVGAAVDMVRHDIAEGPVIGALVSVGRANPDAALAVAEALAGNGEAEYAAFLIGGAYEGAPGRCDGMIESLGSSGSPASVAASLLSLRVAYTEHGAPGAGRIADAVDDALRIDDDDEVHREAMEALLDIHAADRKRTGPMIRELAMRRHVCKSILASYVSFDPPLSDDERIEYMDICIEGASDSDSGVVRSAYRLLKKMAGGHPERVARGIVKLAEMGAYVDSRAGPVIAELGRRHPEVATDAILSVLRLAPKGNIEKHLPSMVQRAAKFSDPASVSGTMLAALESEPEMSRQCRLALAELR